MRKTTAEEWENAFEELRVWCEARALEEAQGLGEAGNPKDRMYEKGYSTGRVETLKDVLDRIRLINARNYPNPAPEEPETMTLSEIVALAEPGDTFTNPGRKALRHVELTLSATNLICHNREGRKTEALLYPNDLMRDDWYFTKRAPRCPTCGGRVEEK